MFEFQSTLPREERQTSTRSIPGSSDFNPRSHERSDPVPSRSHSSFTPFQSTLPREERRRQTESCTTYTIFQSTLPREERQLLERAEEIDLAISIHAPTRGATRCPVQLLCDQCISIHAPTRGATGTKASSTPVSDISIHAPTRGATNLSISPVKLSTFQSTLPREERQIQQYSGGTQGNYFNPRSHERSDG